jgi:hypothetical protein
MLSLCKMCSKIHISCPHLRVEFALWKHCIQMIIVSSMMDTKLLSMICEVIGQTLRIDKLALRFKSGRQTWMTT